MLGLDFSGANRSSQRVARANGCSTGGQQEEALPFHNSIHKSPICFSPLCTTRFSPICELPRLERWFRSEPNPSRQKLLSYMNLLNNSPYRRANNKVTYQQICNWFINQRRTVQRQTFATRQSSSNPTAAPQKPMAVLPLNATGGPAATTHQFGPGQANLALLNSLATALANGSMDQAQVQQKVAALLSGMGEERNHLQMEQNHQIPLANGPPMDIRAKFDGNAEQEGVNGTAQEGQQGGQHSDVSRGFGGKTIRHGFREWMAARNRPPATTT